MVVFFSCVLDNNAVMAQQAYLWAQTLLKFAGRKPEELVIHSIDSCEPEYTERLKALGVRLVPTQTFDPRHLPSNKLAQLESELLCQADYVVLTDCDIAFAADIAELFEGDRARAKIVDNANLAPSDWKAIFKMAGFGEPAIDVVTTSDKKPTVANYCNGGLIVLPKSLYARIGSLWKKWDRWLLDRPDLLGNWTYYTDQVSFTLALRELGEQVDPLPNIYNFPVHHELAPSDLPTQEPKVLHYHDALDPMGYIRKVGAPVVDEAIEAINTLIAENYKSDFSNKFFWQTRYKTRPDVGSGVGSRGHDLLVKRRLLEYVVEQLAPQSVLDIGCGDLELSRELKVERYTGVDISSAAIAIAKEKRPYWNFQVGDALDLDLAPHEMVLCFDVTIHQPTIDAYRGLCQKLQGLATRYLVLAGYNQPPWLTSAITFYYEPLSETLGRGEEGHLSIVGGYRDTTILLWSRHGPPDWKDTAVNRRTPLRRMLSRAKRALLRR